MIRETREVDWFVSQTNGNVRWLDCTFLWSAEEDWKQGDQLLQTTRIQGVSHSVRFSVLKPEKSWANQIVTLV